MRQSHAKLKISNGSAPKITALVRNFLGSLSNRLQATKLPARDKLARYKLAPHRKDVSALTPQHAHSNVSGRFHEVTTRVEQASQFWAPPVCSPGAAGPASTGASLVDSMVSQRQ